MSLNNLSYLDKSPVSLTHLLCLDTVVPFPFSNLLFLDIFPVSLTYLLYLDTSASNEYPRYRMRSQVASNEYPQHFFMRVKVLVSTHNIFLQTEMRKKCQWFVVETNAFSGDM